MPCIFCQREFTPDNRDTVEHVLKRSWIDALGHGQAPMPGQWIQQGRVIREFEGRSALNLLTGRICARCNNGWMNDLDESISDQLLGLARGAISISDLDAPSRFRFARWLLKTTCVVRSGSPKYLRHLHTNLMRSVEAPDFMPRGFIGYALILEPGRRGIRASSMHNWIAFEGDTMTFFALPEEQRTKAAFQFDRLVIGCAWVTTYGAPRYRGLHGFHDVFFLNDAAYDVHAPDRVPTMVNYVEDAWDMTQAIQIALGCELALGPVGSLAVVPTLGTYSVPNGLAY